MDAPLAEVRSGLDSILPRKSGSLDLTAGWSSKTGPIARGELRQRFGNNLAGYLYGQWTPAQTSAGAGVRVTW